MSQSPDPPPPDVGTSLCDFFIAVLESTHHEMGFNKRRIFEKKSLYKVVQHLEYFYFIAFFHREYFIFQPLYWDGRELYIVLLV